ncbi:MAG: SpoVA/SpoVAEb family sporulation membrane protein [Clostridia bacterium]|nr:SpoVA/SpoVAEb family sporulation membrane protein [Clostridia bacterium]
MPSLIAGRYELIDSFQKSAKSFLANCFKSFKDCFLSQGLTGTFKYALTSSMYSALTFSVGLLCIIINIDSCHFKLSNINHTSLYFIIPHRCFNVNILKILCPILTAAEGYILGLGAKMFTIAGPVIVYGVSASVVYGLIYGITTLF